MSSKFNFLLIVMLLGTMPAGAVYQVKSKPIRVTCEVAARALSSRWGNLGETIAEHVVHALSSDPQLTYWQFVPALGSAKEPRVHIVITMSDAAHDWNPNAINARIFGSVKVPTIGTIGPLTLLEAGDFDKNKGLADPTLPFKIANAVVNRLFEESYRNRLFKEGLVRQVPFGTAVWYSTKPATIVVPVQYRDPTDVNACVFSVELLPDRTLVLGRTDRTVKTVDVEDAARLVKKGVIASAQCAQGTDLKVVEVQQVNGLTSKRLWDAYVYERYKKGVPAVLRCEQLNDISQ